MLRAQVQLTEEQHRRLRALARRDGVSIAEVVRRSVDRLLDEETGDRGALYARAAELVGAFADRGGATDLATRHDDYLDEAYG